MTTMAHEEKILNAIEQLSFCTECLEDYVSCALSEFGATWRYLCWKCCARARDRMRRSLAHRGSK